MKISVIIPCYNALGKIERCIKSLENQTLQHQNFEVIFVDDASTDETANYLRRICIEHMNWQVHVLDRNTGSPSHPRNVGQRLAKGDYVFYLDCDDELLSDTLQQYLIKAEATSADVIRGHLIADDGASRKSMNELPAFPESGSKTEKISEIIGKQSTTVCQLIRTSLLRKFGIQWPESIRMGEDTLFLIDVLAAADTIVYIDHPTFIYHKAQNGEASSTQTYGARELRNHLKVWSLAQSRLQAVGVDYLKLRLRVGLQSVLLALIRHYTHDIKADLFREFAAFIDRNRKLIDSFSYNNRLKSILETLYRADYEAFLLEIRPRMVIAGYDLKFIRAAIPSLERFYNIQIDEWTGHASHDVEKSRKLLQWAELIFCEWLLGNAVWYAENKRPDQRLAVRVHRFELTTPWRQKIDHTKVDCFIAVSLYFVEKVIELVGCPRGKVTLIPNFLDVDAYQLGTAEERTFNLSMIGILPRKKGFRQALQVLRDLVEIDSRYSLTIYGKQPGDLPWLVNNPEEMAYYADCERFIEESNLKNQVHYSGWVDVTKEMKNIGFVLSMSEKDELFESFHLAPADGFAGGGIGLLMKWNGVEYIYPEEYLCDTVDEITNRIHSYNTATILDESSARGRAFIKDRYSTTAFCAAFRKAYS